ncbi:MAG: tRNA lysidine(34) synthetase TilS [Gammaproteobacteria bacterium]|nr:tRNA lysidine(34) synthetase TilS [Gammaproteobacteria bacterium]
MSNNLKKAVLSSVDQHHSIRVALSGGIDSVALLMLLYELKQNNVIPYFDAICIGHKTEHSHKSIVFCKQLCSSLGIDLIIKSIKEPVIKNKEAQWREARYGEISACTSLMTHVFLAHHENDQAETFLLNALRGTGLIGLSAMKKIHTYDNRIYKRPFLSIQRHELKQYLIERNIDWLDDPSNIDDTFKRNFIRHKIMPLLEEKWPQASKTLARTAANLSIEDRDSSAINQLKLWLKKVDITLDKKTIKDLYKQLSRSPYDKTSVIKLKDYLLYKHKDKLTLCIQTLPLQPVKINPKENITKLNTFLAMQTQEICTGYGLDIKYIDDIYIKPRQGGETIQLSPDRPKQKVKKILQSYDLPPYLTIDMPLLYYKNELIGIPGLLIKHSYTSLKNSFQFKLIILEKNQHQTFISCNNKILNHN